MLGRDVADVRGEAVRREEAVHPPHQPIADYLRHDRGGGDRGAPLVAVDDRGVFGRHRRRSEPEAVDEADFARRRERVQRGTEAVQVAVVEPVAVDAGGRERVDADPLGTAEDGAEQLLAPLGRQLLGVVEQGERPDLGATERSVVEQDACDEQGPGER